MRASFGNPSPVVREAAHGARCGLETFESPVIVAEIPSVASVAPVFADSKALVFSTETDCTDASDAIFAVPSQVKLNKPVLAPVTVASVNASSP